MCVCVCVCVCDVCKRQKEKEKEKERERDSSHTHFLWFDVQLFLDQLNEVPTVGLLFLSVLKE